MTFDTVERIGKTEVHHGVLNDRLYLEKLHKDDLVHIFGEVEGLARKKNYGKIVSKVPKWALDTFLEKGYRVEAEIPGLYGGDTDGYFLAGYLNPQRFHRPDKEIRFIESVKTIALATSDASPKVPYKDFTVKPIRIENLQELASLNKQVFPNYPYPIAEATYLRECLEHSFKFYGLYRGNDLQEAAILKLNREEGHAEIIDFVTPTALKGKNRSYHLLSAIKQEVKANGLKTLYSSIRATSYGLNITFKKQGFRYGGTLVNNTTVGDTLESMNIWYWHNHPDEI